LFQSVPGIEHCRLASASIKGGGWGAAIQGALNSAATPTMANFATLATYWLAAQRE
jgi:hypothetical protein